VRDRENLVDDKETLKQEGERLLGPFRFVERNKREVWEAFKANPDGVERCALLAKAKAQRAGVSGAGLLLTMIRSGEHLLEPDLSVKSPTGWRWVTGEGHAAGTFVEDPNGTDRLPAAYDFTTHNLVLTEPRPDEIEVAPVTDAVKVELDRLAGRA
jgi:hypothetical protein